MGRKRVGILLNSAMHRGIPRRKTGQESLLNYEEAASVYDMTPCYLKLEDIDTHSGFCYAYIKESQGYRRTVIPIPDVIHNRAIYSRENAGMEQLIRKGPLVFNTCNRYGKDVIHELLGLNPELRRFLPATEKGMSGLKYMMTRFPDLILKPCRGSVGNGVMRLTRRENGGWSWSYRSQLARRWVSVPIDQDALPRQLLHRLAVVPYLVQERIPLAEITGRPFDLRVTVQRGWGGEWQITGLFAKLAPPGGFVSNIARGGEAVPSSLALERVFSGEKASNIRMSAGSLGLAIARCLEQSLPGLADIGLDIGITGEGHPYFIECNGRDQRYGFHKAGLAETWKESYNRPMSYARYLLERVERG
ncbi:YheC/YheD family protein [Paenibacillus sp. BR2-3]|uniref:YheC/YheD family endospore coat-associated protein n=1 Tax=Paenibacillus sp. BR2-3 TaxID=3048494 RepID=UPI0039773E14